MGVNHPGVQLSLEELIRIVRREAVATIQNASIGRAGLRVYDGGSITIQGGGLFVTGTQSVSGLLGVSGRLLGSGELVWSGPWELSGAGDITGPVDIDGNLTLNGSSRFVGPVTVQGVWDFTGNGSIRGNVDVTGALDVKNRLTLGPAGYFEAGTVRIDRGGSFGGRIRSAGAVLALSATGSVVVDDAVLVAGETSLGATSVLSLNTLGAKKFRIPHPTIDDHWLSHGATESPVSGIEYWGEGMIDDDGSCEVDLPEYFEALSKPGGRTVLVTGRGFIADWSDIVGGQFTVTGRPGGRFSWLVKAERRWADFETTEPVFGPLRESV